VEVTEKHMGTQWLLTHGAIFWSTQSIAQELYHTSHVTYQK